MGSELLLTLLGTSWRCALGQVMSTFLPLFPHLSGGNNESSHLKGCCEGRNGNVVKPWKKGARGNFEVGCYKLLGITQSDTHTYRQIHIFPCSSVLWLGTKLSPLSNNPIVLSLALWCWGLKNQGSASTAASRGAGGIPQGRRRGLAPSCRLPVAKTCTSPASLPLSVCSHGGDQSQFAVFPALTEEP